MFLGKDKMRKTIIYETTICILFSLTMLFAEHSVAQEEITYQGPTVTISGRIDFPGYKEGLLRIRISAKSFPGEGRADIAYVDIPRPGEYSLKVPQNIGNVYISALILELVETVPRKGVSLGTQYNGNPIKVNTEDISGVNITLPY